MSKIESAQIFMTASLLAALFTIPAIAIAEDYTQPAPPAREPVYVWQGNRIENQPGAPSTPATPAQDANNMPQMVQAGSVRYITGGIGDEERAMLEAVKNDYNLHITSASNSGEFNGDTQISISNLQGQSLLNVSAGPLFYVDLPAGTYKVQAMSDGRSEERKVTVWDKKSSSLYFRW